MDTQGSKSSGEHQPHRQSRKYRVNIRRFTRSLILLGCLIAVVCLVFYFSGKTVPAIAQAASAEAKPNAAVVSKAGTAAIARKVVVVDAGHGGFDIGATGTSGEHESDLNLKVAEYLKADFEQDGAQVIMTRADENAIAASKDDDMAKRRQIIQQSGSDIVVSVHMNADTNPSVSGPIVLYSPNAIQGEKLAKLIQNSLLKTLVPPAKNSARAENLYILQSGAQPSVLVECGFITNTQEDALLLQDEYQKNVAEAIEQGCLEFLQAP